MEPRIQYAKTRDGVSLAYWTMGEGDVPLVMSGPMMFTHTTFELRHPVLRAWYERLASRRMIVRYDFRGQGLSQRNVGPFDFDQFVTDMEDIIEHLGLERFDLAGFYGPNSSHVIYAARHPERVRRLVLWSPLESTAPEGQTRVVLTLIESDWKLFTETFAHTFLGWTGDIAHEWASFMRVAINQEDAVNLFAVVAQGNNVREYLPQVQAPTLVLYEAEGRRGVTGQAAHVASAIPGARLLPLPHKVMSPFESELGTRAIEDFLADGNEPVTRAAVRQDLPSGTAVILFADIADSTALTERLGDAAFREKARELDEALRRAIASNGGAAIDGKLLGDGVLATFGAAREAIGCAAAIHDAGSHAGLPLHIGIHAGDVIREEGNVYGGAVNVAARVAGEAAAGETLVSATVRELARTSAGVAFEDRGERELKGVGEPVRVFAVRSLAKPPFPRREGAGG